jgi:hypothetical protein
MPFLGQDRRGTLNDDVCFVLFFKVDQIISLAIEKVVGHT